MSIKLKHYTSLTVKCIAEIDMFQALDVTKFLMCSVDLDMGTSSGTTHIQTIFSIWTGTDKHFIGNALCSSFTFCSFFTINNIFYKFPRSNTEGSNLEDESGTHSLNSIPLLHIQRSGNSCPERPEHDWISDVVHRLTGKLFPQEHD